MAKKTPGEEILEAIIAKGRGPAAEQAKAELVGYKEAKQQLAATIKPSISRSVQATPSIEKSAIEAATLPTVASGRENVSDFGQLKESNKQILDVSKKSQTILENILKVSTKYQEDTNELLKRLLVANDLNAARDRENSKELLSAIGSLTKAARGTEPLFPKKDGQPEGEGGDGFFGGFFGGRGGRAARRPGGRPGGALRGLGRFGAGTVGATALGVGAFGLLDYLAEEDEGKRQEIKDKFTPLAIAGGGYLAQSKLMALKESLAQQPATEMRNVKKQVPEYKVSGKYATKEAYEAAVKEGKKKVSKELVEKTVKEVGQKQSTRVALKSIPFVSALTGSAFAAYKAYEGDYVGAALNLGSGLAGMFPGPGTAASVGLSVVELSREVYKALYGEYPEKDLATYGSKYVQENMKQIQESVANYLEEITKENKPQSEGPTDYSMSADSFGLEPSAPERPYFNPTEGVQSLPVGTQDTTPDVFGDMEKSAAEANRYATFINRQGVVPLPVERPVRPSVSQGAGVNNVTIVEGNTTVNNNVMGGGRSMEMPSGTATPTAPTNPWDFSLYGQRGVRPTY